MKKHKQIFTLATLILGVGTLISAHAAVPFTDDFNTDHNYATLGVTGTGWDGILNASNLGSGSAATGGVLNWEDTGNHGWQNTQHDAPFLYLDVTGDFSAEVEISLSGITTGSYATGGLMVSNIAGGSTDWMQVSYSSWQSLNRVMNTDDNVTNEPGFQTAQPFLRVERVGDNFSFFTRPNEGSSWQILGPAISRPDMPATLQVGVQFGMFDTPPGNIKYENFNAVPEPATAMLAISGLGMIAMRRRRAS